MSPQHRWSCWIEWDVVDVEGHTVIAMSASMASSSTTTPSRVCLRCLRQSLSAAIETPRAAQRAAAFSSSSRHSNVVKKKSTVTAKPAARAGNTLRLAKNVRVPTSRPPAVGERRTLRKKVVLSNTNALEVQGLRDLSASNARAESLPAARGKVVGLSNDTVDALRAAEAFKPTQGWNLFRRPATLIRDETVELAKELDWIAAGGKEARRLHKVLFGTRGSGKSVLQLQALAIASLKKWVIVHVPDAKDLTNAHTSYEPSEIKNANGDTETLYIQPHYTAKLLDNIAKANHAVLSKLTLQETENYELPVRLSANTTLAELAEIGARDPGIAFPVWQALWSELTSTAAERPPIMFSLDAVDHVMRQSAYLNAESEPIHAHELALVRRFVNLLDGSHALPNGGMVLAAISESNRAAAHTLDHALKVRLATQQRQTVQRRVAKLEQQLRALKKNNPNLVDTPSEADALHLKARDSDSKDHRKELHLREELRKLRDSPLPAIPAWDPYIPYDKWVQDALKDVTATKVEGLSKEEARGVMEYYARSGMLRSAVTDGFVSENWTLAGGGIIGLLEQGSVKAKF